jgi:hypothetical protein
MDNFFKWKKSICIPRDLMGFSVILPISFILGELKIVYNIICIGKTKQKIKALYFSFKSTRKIQRKTS